MMALSALSLAPSGTQSTEALEHYQQALPAMRQFAENAEDSNSNGALLTHYLLLLYEVSIMEGVLRILFLWWSGHHVE
jgi:hypothetical protein